MWRRFRSHLARRERSTVVATGASFSKSGHRANIYQFTISILYKFEYSLIYLNNDNRYDVQNNDKNCTGEKYLARARYKSRAPTKEIPLSKFSAHIWKRKRGSERDTDGADGRRFACASWIALL